MPVPDTWLPPTEEMIRRYQCDKPFNDLADSIHRHMRESGTTYNDYVDAARIAKGLQVEHNKRQE